MNVAQRVQFRRDSNAAEQAVNDAIRILLGPTEPDSDEQLTRALLPLRSRGVWYLATLFMASQVARCIREPLGPHECANPACRDGRPIIDALFEQRTEAAMDGLTKLVTFHPDRVMGLVDYLLASLVTAIEAGALLPPETPKEKTS